MVAFIDQHRESFGVESICRQLPIAPSVYYEQKARQRDPELIPARQRLDAALREEVKRVFVQSRCRYGARKVWLQLAREGSAPPSRMSWPSGPTTWSTATSRSPGRVRCGSRISLTSGRWPGSFTWRS